ncbi:hypothetical protein PHISCL_03361 [Aspergillus sclerotialis]|uniref:Uncharacterized protein n=1 Tax=Aspergillus sclerotialis TaxID=2070753 RepID=A0A3A2ZMR7_9EURO|nr:hypothetical protein PHISCL_03361 [Aspergillus sclerotialis]
MASSDNGESKVYEIQKAHSSIRRVSFAVLSDLLPNETEPQTQTGTCCQGMAARNGRNVSRMKQIKPIGLGGFHAMPVEG